MLIYEIAGPVQLSCLFIGYPQKLSRPRATEFESDHGFDCLFTNRKE